jgi:RNA polymerase sigma-70 factor (ECF subfamily)
MTQTAEFDWNGLFDAARQGDERSLGQVCERLRDYLLLVADRGLFDGLRAKLGASDIVQQTMLEAQQDFDRFAGTSEEELRTWFVKIVEHNLIDSARRYRETQQRDLSREVPMNGDDKQFKLVGPQKTASSIVCRRETDEQLLRAVARLPENRRRIIELRHRQSLPYAEIAEQMNITEVAARKLWSRTVETLRQELAATNDGGPGKPR